MKAQSLSWVLFLCVSCLRAPVLFKQGNNPHTESQVHTSPISGSGPHLPKPSAKPLNESVGAGGLSFEKSSGPRASVGPGSLSPLSGASFKKALPLSHSSSGSGESGRSGKASSAMESRGLSVQEYESQVHRAAQRFDVQKKGVESEHTHAPERILLLSLQGQTQVADALSEQVERLLRTGEWEPTNRRMSAGDSRPHIAFIREKNVDPKKENIAKIEVVLKPEVPVKGRFQEPLTQTLPEVGAYRLSRLMGLGHVPPAVERSVNGTRQSAQVVVEQGVSVQELPDELVPYVNTREIMRDQRIFAALLQDTDRNWGNMLVHRDFPALVWWIDFSNLDPRKDTPQFGQFAPPSARFVRGLSGLTAQRVRQQLDPVLAPRQVDNVLRNIGAAQDAFKK